MRLAGILPASTVLLPLLLALVASPPCHGAASHSIKDILASHPDFTEFSAALASTGAAAEIDNHNTITVLAVDNAVMAQLKAQQLKPRDLEHVIYLQILFDYFDAAKLASIKDGFALATSLFQASGKAQAAEGMVNVTVLPGSRAAFALSGAPSNAPPAAFYKQSIKEVPYDIAVLQVSALIWSPAQPAAVPPQAPAPLPDAAPAPAPASSPSHTSPPAPAPAPSAAHGPPPAPAPASSPAHAHPPAIAPAVAPVAPPTPRRRPAPAPEDSSPADAPDADSQPPADEKNSGPRDMASWSLGTAVAAAVPAIVLLL